MGNRLGLDLCFGVTAMRAAPRDIQNAHVLHECIGLGAALLPATNAATRAGRKLWSGGRPGFQRSDAFFQFGHLVRRSNNALPFHKFLQ